MKEEWKIHAKRADFKALSEKYNIDQVAARVMVNRGIEECDMEHFLNPGIKYLNDPHMLKGAMEAANLLKNAIEEGKRIRVIGDYDIDGVTSTYILVSALKKCGADVDFAIPHRIEDGYGMNVSMVEKACIEGVEFIITCDNGIAARDAVQFAKDSGMSVVVTDHHEIPYEMVNEKKEYILPNADVIVNPHQEECNYPFKEICGAVVAWKLVFILYEVFGMDKEAAFEFLDAAAFATIGDVMPLINENRDIVKCGLEAISKTKNNGLKALIAATNTAPDKITSYQIGFILGPCINASGRLETARMAVGLLLENDVKRAAEMASKLVEINAERKAMTLEGTEEAMQLIAEQKLDEDKVLVLYMPKLHESLAGIVAGRVKETFYKPTFVLTDTEDGVKGSGRSIEAYSMFEELTKVKDILTKFGGHPMAAGVSMNKEDVEEFRRRLNDNASLTGDDLTKKVMIDVKMPLSYVSEKLITDLECLEPFGMKNEKPVFAEANVPIKRISYIGKDKKFLKLRLDSGNGREIDALYFGDADSFKECFTNKYSEEEWENIVFGRGSNATMSFLYYPSINEFDGRINLQVIIQGFM